MKNPESFTVTLPWPPSTNRIWRNVVTGGKPRTLLSEDGRRYRSDVGTQCMISRINAKQLSGRLEVSMIAYPPDNRSRDIDNLIKACLDAMTHAGVWVDDSQIDILSIRRGGIKKGGAMAVTFSEI
jgi:crossover junction endodeoxyribonuclease RusA